MQIRWARTVLLALLFAGVAGIHQASTQDEKQALAPTGKLRAAFVVGQPAMDSVAMELGRELAGRIGVPFEVVEYKSPIEVANRAQSGEWDITFIAILPERTKIIDFSAPYAQVEMGFLVPKDSSISTLSDVDKPGVRISVLEKSIFDTLLSQTHKSATLVRSSTFGDAVEAVRAGKADAFVAIKTILFRVSDRLIGSRVLEGRIGIEDIGIGVPKGREALAAYVRKFVDEAKSTGRMKAMIERAASRGLLAAP